MPKRPRQKPPKHKRHNGRRQQCRLFFNDAANFVPIRQFPNLPGNDILKNRFCTHHPWGRIESARNRGFSLVPGWVAHPTVGVDEYVAPMESVQHKRTAARVSPCGSLLLLQASLFQQGRNLRFPAQTHDMHTLAIGLAFPDDTGGNLHAGDTGLGFFLIGL